MYRIFSFLFTLAAFGFGFAACDQDPNSPEGLNRGPSVAQQKNVPDAQPALPAPVLAKARSSKTDHTVSSQNANSASESVVNERDYLLKFAENILVPCCYEEHQWVYIWGYGHLVETPSGQIHININGSDFYAFSDQLSGSPITGTGYFISNLGSEGSSGQDKSVAKIKMTTPEGCVWYLSLYLRFVDGEPEIYVAEVTCEE